MRYVMVTDWRGHWDKVSNGKTSYTSSMLVPPMSPAFFRDGTPTVFLLLAKRPRSPLRAWAGKVTEIERSANRKEIFFRVTLSRETRFPRKYAELADGWYVEEPESAAVASGLW